MREIQTNAPMGGNGKKAARALKGVLLLNPFELPDHPPSPRPRMLRVKTHIRELVRALIRNS